MQDLADRAELIQPVPGRLEPVKLQNNKRNHNILLINDSYNASPTSVKAAIDVLADITDYNHKILVLADMLELGDKAPDYHRDIGRYAAEKHIDGLFTLGDYTENSLQTFRCLTRRRPGVIAESSSNLEDLWKNLTTFIEQTHYKIALLIKGSHSMQLYRLVEDFIRN